MQEDFENTTEYSLFLREAADASARDTAIGISAINIAIIISGLATSTWTIIFSSLSLLLIVMTRFLIYVHYRAEIDGQNSLIFKLRHAATRLAFFSIISLLLSLFTLAWNY